MFETVREDWRRHGSLIHNRALLTLWVYRLGRWGMAQKSEPVRWLVAQLYGVLYFFTEAFTGVCMRKEVTIGEGFHLIHPGSTFIHPKVVIGDRVGVMQNVVIGTNMDDRVPVIGNDVFIGANACVLGAIKVGDGARIAANSLVVNDVPPNSFAVGVPAKAFPRLGIVKKG